MKNGTYRCQPLQVLTLWSIFRKVLDRRVIIFALSASGEQRALPDISIFGTIERRKWETTRDTRREGRPSEETYFEGKIQFECSAKWRDQTLYREIPPTSNSSSFFATILSTRSASFFASSSVNHLAGPLLLRCNLSAITRHMHTKCKTTSVTAKISRRVCCIYPWRMAEERVVGERRKEGRKEGRKEVDLERRWLLRVVESWTHPRLSGNRADRETMNL